MGVFSDYFIHEQQNMLYILLLLSRIIFIFVFSLLGSYSKEYINKSKNNEHVSIMKMIISSFASTMFIVPLYNNIIDLYSKDLIVLISYIGGFFGYNILTEKMSNINNFTEFIKYVFEFFKK